MFLQNLRARLGARLSGDSEAGFTLIELLVVMLILGILAAIALPAFFNQKDKAGDSKAKETAHSAQVAIETFATEHNGSYAGANPKALNEIEPTIPFEENASKEVTSDVTVPAATANGYEVAVKSSTGNVFTIKNVKGAMSYPCTLPESGANAGGCSNVSGTAGTWGE
jgi:type IV pilus assembly protein PilA